MSRHQPPYWFADTDVTVGAGKVWAPFLYATDGTLPGLEVWHSTREECEAWMREQGMRVVPAEEVGE